VCIRISYRRPRSRSVRSWCVAICPGDETPFSEEPIETPRRSEQTELVANLKTDTGAPLFIVAATSLIFTPLELRSAGLMRVRAMIDADQELRLGSLRIEHAA
jgi:hypothetical protein